MLVGLVSGALAGSAVSRGTAVVIPAPLAAAPCSRPTIELVYVE